MDAARKWPVVAFLPLVAVGLVVWLVVLPHLDREDHLPSAFVVPCLASTAVWTLVLLWAAHHTVFQVVGLWPRKPEPPPPPTGESVRFAILYMTCDDFLSACCDSCRQQDYPSEAYRVFVCDDSRTEAARRAVEEYCRSHPTVELVRRKSQTGYKAGNLNHAFHHLRDGKWEWVVVADADQTLPRTFLRELAPHVARQAESVGFVQAGRQPDAPATAAGAGEGTPFQDALQTEMLLYFERQMVPRAAHGFVPFLGHGGAVRWAAWKAVGGFPEVVSEDFAFALKGRSVGVEGVLLDSVRSGESHPKDFGAFLTRWGKFAAGGAELLRSCFPPFLFGPRATLTERYDAALQLGTYALLPLFLVNLFLSAYLCHHFHAEHLPASHPFLPFVFLALLLVSVSNNFSVARNPWHAVRFWFWSYAVYLAALPTAAWQFAWHLFRRPAFHRTPKGHTRSPRFPAAGIATVLLGGLALLAAVVWPSPFRFILISAGVAFISFPLYSRLDSHSPLGVLARVAVYLPGVAFLVGFVEMWLWR